MVTIKDTFKVLLLCLLDKVTFSFENSKKVKLTEMIFCFDGQRLSVIACWPEPSKLSTLSL